MIDGFGLMKEGGVAARASGHCASKRRIESKLIPGQPSAEWAVCLIEWLLGKKERAIKFGFESPAKRSITRAEFRLEVVAIFRDDVIESEDWVEAHGESGKEYGRELRLTSKR